MSTPESAYRPTIGLEIHAELRTATKMFCDSKNDPDEEHPNVNICPVCLAHPGTLPTINKEAVRQVLRVGSALGGTLADYTEFDRKSYFYPDIPKGYQISQYERPLVAGGSLNGVSITRVHLEEDTARSTHGTSGSLVDFNRAGVPLMELVTEPVIHSAKQAGDFARELQLLLRALGASEANLEKGEMRIEANVSVSRDDSFGTKVEVKNLNSFRSVERAILFEVERQITLIESGGTVVQETRGWDETKEETFHQRFKEGSADYRYFPDPDLPKLILSEVEEFLPEAIAATLPELPAVRRARYVAELGFKEENAAFVASVSSRSEFIDAVAPYLTTSRQRALAENYFVTDLAGDSGSIEPAEFAKLLRYLEEGALSSRGAKDALTILKRDGGEVDKVVTLQVSDDSALLEVVRKVVAENEKVVSEYRGGKEASLQYLVGQAMKAMKGAGNPGKLAELLRESLK